MKIFYDGYIFAMQRTGGVNRYFSNIIARLPPDWEPTLSCMGTPRVNVPQHPRLKWLRFPRFRPLRYFMRLAALGTQRFERAHKLDLRHPTYYETLGGAPQSWREPVVITVYDNIHERYAAQIDPNGDQARAKAAMLRRADAVLCISESTRRDLLEHHDVPPERVRVTLLASDLDASRFDSNLDAQLATARPYFLFVGGRDIYKNFDGALLALAQLRAFSPDIELRVAGAPLTPAESARLSELKLSDAVRVAAFPSDAELVSLYRRSLALLYPSRWEGFGLPPLEAMQCDTLVIAGNHSSLPEVVGHAGLLFDPDARDALLEQMRAVAENNLDRDELVRRGRAQAARFSWEQTAAQTLAVYRELAG